MKNILPLPFIFLLASLSICAQNSETIRVKAGNDIAAAVSDYGIYCLPAFVNGTVFFKDGKLGKELLNYNILNDQMMYIDKKGDTQTYFLLSPLKRRGTFARHQRKFLQPVCKQ